MHEQLKAWLGPCSLIRMDGGQCCKSEARGWLSRYVNHFTVCLSKGTGKKAAPTRLVEKSPRNIYHAEPSTSFLV